MPLRLYLNVTEFMDGFKNVEISNLRGIDQLTIDDFARVNIFLGQNSSGKSTVLESLFIKVSWNSICKCSIRMRVNK